MICGCTAIFGTPWHKEIHLAVCVLAGNRCGLRRGTFQQYCQKNCLTRVNLLAYSDTQNDCVTGVYSPTFPYFRRVNEIHHLKHVVLHSCLLSGNTYGCDPIFTCCHLRVVIFLAISSLCLKAEGVLSLPFVCPGWAHSFPFSSTDLVPYTDLGGPSAFKFAFLWCVLGKLMLCDIDADHLMPICENLRKTRFGKLTMRVSKGAIQKQSIYLFLILSGEFLICKFINIWLNGKYFPFEIYKMDSPTLHTVLKYGILRYKLEIFHLSSCSIWGIFLDIVYFQSTLPMKEFKYILQSIINIPLQPPCES